MEFKVGDKVKCIEPMGILAHFNAEDTYVVSRAHQDGIHLCFEHTGPSCWHAGRFEVIQPKQFSPKPGDKIICNNGEEFVCCTLETLNARNTVRLINSNSKFFGYDKGKSHCWMQWSDEELVADDAWGVKEVIPAQQEVKQEVAEIVSVQEKTYTLQQIHEVFIALGWPASFDRFCEKLNEPQDPEYKLYLELKAKFEGKE